jgi:hypothetical protein
MLNKDIMDNESQKKTMREAEKPMQIEDKKPDVVAGIHVRGHIKIHDPKTGEVFVDKPNAIHYENISVAIANALSHRNKQFMYEMHFGNGGTAVDSTGIITYLVPNTTSQSANLYNPTYSKNIDDTDTTNNTDPLHNLMQVRHVAGNPYSDIIITCLLDYGEPATQSVFDNSQTLNDTFTFDELGIFAKSLDGTSGLASTGLLLTHVIFHPVQKSLNRLIQIDYTVRIQTLTNLSAIG